MEQFHVFLPVGIGLVFQEQKSLRDPPKGYNPYV